jgi:hypothetical protein
LNVVGGEVLGELVAGGDVKFAVGVVEVHLDGLDGDEECLGDLRVGGAGGGVFDDAPLAGGERGDPGLSVAAYTEAGGGELLAGVVGERLGAAGGSDVKAAAQRFARGATVAAAAQRGAVVDERLSAWAPDKSPV